MCKRFQTTTLKGVCDNIHVYYTDYNMRLVPPNWKSLRSLRRANRELQNDIYNEVGIHIFFLEISFYP